jgi:hypothetical protein
VAFRQHLGANQNINPVPRNFFAHDLPREPCARAVPIDPEYARTWKPIANEAFDPLCSVTDRRKILISAVRARHGQRFSTPAQVADKQAIPQVNHDAGRTPRASGDPIAGTAMENWSIAPAVDEDERLLAAVESFRNCAEDIGAHALL